MTAAPTGSAAPEAVEAVDAVDADIVRQLRSRLRLRLTAAIGAAITLASAGVLVWLLGLTPFASTPDRSTVTLRVEADCPAPIAAAVNLRPSADLVRLALELPDLPGRSDAGDRNAAKRRFFARCVVHVNYRGMLESAMIPGSISGDSLESGAAPPANQELEVGIDGHVGNRVIELTPGDAPNFAGEMLITTKSSFARDSFGRFHVGLDVVVRNRNGMTDLEASISLPEPRMQADVIRPQPVSIGNTPVETYRFRTEASADTENRWIDATYFVGFVDPDKLQIREAALILASTLLGAGISALLEAFLAGGTAALLGKGRPDDGPRRPGRSPEAAALDESAVTGADATAPERKAPYSP